MKFQTTLNVKSKRKILYTTSWVCSDCSGCQALRVREGFRVQWSPKVWLLPIHKTSIDIVSAYYLSYSDFWLLNEFGGGALVLTLPMLYIKYMRGEAFIVCSNILCLKLYIIFLSFQGNNHNIIFVWYIVLHEDIAYFALSISVTPQYPHNPELAVLFTSNSVLMEGNFLYRKQCNKTNSSFFFILIN